MENSRQLHVFRGLSALIVTIGHAKIIFWVGGLMYLQKYPISSWGIADYFLFPIDLASSAGQEFVIVFFVLSGFFITHSFKKNKWSLNAFYINRFLRIFPPYIFAVLISVFVYFWIDRLNPEIFHTIIPRATNVRMLNSFTELNWTNFLRSLVFLDTLKHDYIAGNFSLWSLFHEACFYLGIPFLLNRLKITAIVSFLLVAIGANFFLYNNLILMFLLYYSFSFFAGAYLYDLLIVKKVEVKINKIVSRFLVLVLFIGTLGVGLLEINMLSVLFPVLFSVVTIHSLLNFPIRKGVKIGSFFGDISYTLYLLHLPIFYLGYTVLSLMFGKFIFYERYYWLFVLLAIPISYVAYLLVEKQSINLIKKLKKNKN